MVEAASSGSGRVRAGMYAAQNLCWTERHLIPQQDPIGHMAATVAGFTRDGPAHNITPGDPPAGGPTGREARASFFPTSLIYHGVLAPCVRTVGFDLLTGVLSLDDDIFRPGLICEEPRYGKGKQGAREHKQRFL